MRALIASSRITDRRRLAIEAILGEGAAAEHADPRAGLPPLDAYDALVIDGPPPALGDEGLGAIERLVERGGSLVAIGAAPRTEDGLWSGLLQATAAGPLPLGEYFGRVTGAVSHLTRRLAREFPIVDRFEALYPRRGEGRVLVNVNVGFADRPAVLEVARGRGRIVVCGLGNTDEALASPELRILLRRALRGAPPAGRGGDRGLAVVGYGPFGGMGYYHGIAAHATPGLELVAVCEVSPHRRKAAEADFPGVRTYADVEELAADPAVEIVVVATPPVFHGPLALRMLHAHKHVVCEKPLCLTLAQADEILSVAAEHDLVVTVNHSRRWDQDFVALRRAVEDGLLGEIFNVETFVGGFEHPCRAWHSEVSMSGGAVYDWGAHHVDWILLLMGEMPSSVVTLGHKRVWHDVSQLDQVRVRLSWDDGREAQFLQSDVAAVRPPKFYVQGTAGTLAGWYRPVTFERLEAGRGYVAEIAHHAEAPVDLVLVRYESGRGLVETRLPVAPEQRFAFHRNLADHLELGEPLAVTPGSGRRVIAVLEAAQRSSDDGGIAVPLPGL